MTGVIGKPPQSGGDGHALGQEIVHPAIQGQKIIGPPGVRGLGPELADQIGNHNQGRRILDQKIINQLDVPDQGPEEIADL